MPKTSNQKIKLLYVLRILQRESDEDNPISVARIIEYLEEHGIQAERKSIYSDIATLKDFGIDIISTRGVNSGFYIGSREFQLAELKLLVDSIQSSKFITEKKTRDLTTKLEGLTSKNQAGELQRQVHVQNRVKSMNESVYYIVDDIYRAIQNNKQISFKYVTYNAKKEKEYRHDGKSYVVSPYALIVDGQNYYLVAYEKEEDKIKHFRVEYMDQISLLKQGREGKEKFEEVSLRDYFNKMFNMFGGTEESVKLRVSSRLVNVIIDRFGKNVFMCQENDDDTVIVRANVIVSPQFYGWLLSFGKEMELLSPQNVREDMKQWLSNLYDMY